MYERGFCSRIPANTHVADDSLHSYAWDSQARPTTIDSITVTYDALGRMVEQSNSGTNTEIQYAPTGFKMQTFNGQTVVDSFVPLPGGTVLVPQCTCYFHGDWMGSSRFASRYNDRTMFNDLAYAPFGEQYAKAGNTVVGNESFAGNNEGTTTNLYDAQFREYEIYGRWPSPDPAGMAAANPANPQSWNRYTYVMNMPLLLVDPLGLYDCNISDPDGNLIWSGQTADANSCAELSGELVTYSAEVGGVGGGGPGGWSYGGPPPIQSPLVGPGGPGGGPGAPQTPTPTPQPQQSKIKTAVQNFCGAIGKVGDFLGISGVSASVTGTGSVAGTEATTGIIELGGTGAAGVGALELTPIGVPLTILGLGLIGADLACSL